jgi:hypothetical protein
VGASFVPWVADVLANRLAGDAGRTIAATPGQHLAWPAWADGIEGRPGTHAAGTDFITPADAGTYFFVRSGRRVGGLTVNAEPEESELDRWKPDELARLLGARARVARDEREWTAAVFDTSSRHSMIVPLLVTLLVALGTETVLAGRDSSAES